MKKRDIEVPALFAPAPMTDERGVSVPRPSDNDVQARRRALEGAEASRDALPARIAEAGVRLDTAIASGDDKAADRIERELSGLRRDRRRFELTIPALVDALAEAEDDHRQAVSEFHKAQAQAVFKRLGPALDAVLDINAHGAAVREAAIADGFHDLPFVGVHCMNRAGSEFLLEQLALSLGLVTRPELVVQTTVVVRFLRGFGCYQTDDQIAFPPDKGHEVVRSGAAVYVDPASIESRPVRVRDEQPPEPNEAGEVCLVVLERFDGFCLGSENVQGSYFPGDLNAFPIAHATSLVRGGKARFLPWPTSSQDEGGDE